MPSRVDLDGALNQVEERCRMWLAGELAEEGRAVPTKPCKCKIWYAPNGQSTPEELTEFPLAADHIDAERLRTKIESHLIPIVGPNPAGLLKIRVWEDGLASKPGVLVTRRLQPSLDFGSDAPNVKLLTRMYFRKEDQVERVVGLLEQSNAALATELASMAGAMATLATQRSVGSTGADLGSPWALLGAGAFFLIGYPLLKKQLGLRHDATIDQVAVGLYNMFDAVSARVTGKARPDEVPTATPPAGAADPAELERIKGLLAENYPEAAEELAAQAEPEPVPVDAPPSDDPQAEAMIRLLQTPEGREQVHTLARMAKGRGFDLWNALGIEPPAE